MYDIKKIISYIHIKNIITMLYIIIYNIYIIYYNYILYNYNI